MAVTDPKKPGEAVVIIGDVAADASNRRKAREHRQQGERVSKTFRVTHNGQVHDAFEVGSADLARYRPADGGAGDPDVVGTIMVAQRARIAGGQRLRYRMHHDALLALDHALVPMTNGANGTLYSGEAGEPPPAVVLTFRGVPVFRDDTVPWIDCDCADD